MGSNVIQEMLTCVSMTALGYPAFAVILNLLQDLLNNGQQYDTGDADLHQQDGSGLSVICRHPDLFLYLLYNEQQYDTGDADLRQHDVSGLSVICRHPELVSGSPVQWAPI